MQGVGGSSPPSSTTSFIGQSVKLRWYREAPLRPDGEWGDFFISGR